MLPGQFGAIVSCDHVVLRQPDEGLHGERAGLQLADLGTENWAFYPGKEKTYHTFFQSIRDFVGNDHISKLSSDNAPELIRMAAELTVPLATATPYRSTRTASLRTSSAKCWAAVEPYCFRAVCLQHGGPGQPQLGATCTTFWENQARE